LAGDQAARIAQAGHAVVRRPAEAPAGVSLSIRVAEGRFGATSTGATSMGAHPGNSDHQQELEEKA
jgi:exodeoxyribonuclease VII large subunit